MAVLVTLSRWIDFEAAHSLPETPTHHKCHGLHGHSYRLIVECTGPVRADGFVFDNALIDDALEQLHRMLDHSILNTRIDNPTAEHMLVWIWAFLAESVIASSISAVELHEGPRSVFRMTREQQPVLVASAEVRDADK